MATTIKVEFSPSQEGTGEWGYNHFSATAVGSLTSDLKDITNTSTNYTLAVANEAFDGVSGNDAIATADVGDWPDEIFDFYYYDSGSAQIVIGGLTQNDTYSLEVAGHNSNSSRDTDFTVTPANEGETTYDSAGTGTPNAPITFTGTIGAAGTITIEGAVVSAFWYFNGFKLTITEGAGGGPNTLSLLGVG